MKEYNKARIIRLKELERLDNLNNAPMHNIIFDSYYNEAVCSKCEKRWFRTSYLMNKNVIGACISGLELDE